MSFLSNNNTSVGYVTVGADCTTTGNWTTITTSGYAGSDYQWFIVDEGAHSPFLPMSDTVRDYHKLEIDEDMQKLIDAGLYDEYGNPTEAGLRIYIEELLKQPQNKKVLQEVADALEKKKEKKKKKCNKSCC